MFSGANYWIHRLLEWDPGANQKVWVIRYTYQLTKNPQRLTLGWILECRWAHYCWWFRNPANHLGCIKTLKNNGIFTMPYLTGAGFIPSTVSMEDSSFSRKCLRSFRVPSRHRCEFSVGSTGPKEFPFLGVRFMFDVIRFSWIRDVTTKLLWIHQIQFVCIYIHKLRLSSGFVTVVVFAQPRFGGDSIAAVERC